MKKGKFRLIVAAMSLALTGLIFLQVYWIMHDFEIKSKQFDRSVMLAMNSMVEKIEEKENLKLVVKSFISTGDSSRQMQLIDDSLRNLLSAVIYDPPVTPQYTPPPRDLTQIESDYKKLENEISQRLLDYRQRARERKPTEEGIVYNLDTSIDIRIERDIEQKEVIALKIGQQSMLMDSIEQLTKERMQSKLRKLNTMMQKLTFQIVDPSRDLFDRISRKDLDSIIRAELRNRDLDIDFSYGISKDNRAEWKYLSPNADSVMLKYSDYKLVLFPNDVFKSNNFLSISFRDRLNYLLDGIWAMMLFSLAFTVIIIWGFTYTLRVILRQKKLADIKNDFINNMTHEFKTPIATIALANESMRNPRIYSSAEKMEFYNNIIRDENQRMLRQVETVLQMAQIDKGELKYNREKCNLNELVENAIASMQLTIQQRNGIITFDKMKESAFVSGDPNHLSNVFINILDNANKYTLESPVINVSLYTVPEGYCVEIADNGIGMSKEVMRRIFDNFYRAASGNIHDVKGFGLGLSYVKAIVDEHGGTIQVKSEAGKGSRFIVILPAIKE